MQNVKFILIFLILAYAQEEESIFKNIQRIQRKTIELPPEDEIQIFNKNEQQYNEIKSIASYAERISQTFQEDDNMIFLQLSTKKVEPETLIQEDNVPPLKKLLHKEKKAEEEPQLTDKPVRTVSKFSLLKKISEYKDLSLEDSLQEQQKLEEIKKIEEEEQRMREEIERKRIEEENHRKEEIERLKNEQIAKQKLEAAQNIKPKEIKKEIFVQEQTKQQDDGLNSLDYSDYIAEKANEYSTEAEQQQQKTINQEIIESHQPNELEIVQQKIEKTQKQEDKSLQNDNLEKQDQLEDAKLDSVFNKIGNDINNVLESDQDQKSDDAKQQSSVKNQPEEKQSKRLSISEKLKQTLLNSDIDSTDIQEQQDVQIEKAESQIFQANDEEKTGLIQTNNSDEQDKKINEQQNEQEPQTKEDLEDKLQESENQQENQKDNDLENDIKNQSESYDQIQYDFNNSEEQMDLSNQTESEINEQQNNQEQQQPQQQQKQQTQAQQEQQQQEEKVQQEQQQQQQGQKQQELQQDSQQLQEQQQQKQQENLQVDNQIKEDSQNLDSIQSTQLNNLQGTKENEEQNEEKALIQNDIQGADKSTQELENDVQGTDKATQELDHQQDEKQAKEVESNQQQIQEKNDQLRTEQLKEDQQSTSKNVENIPDEEKQEILGDTKNNSDDNIEQQKQIQENPMQEINNQHDQNQKETKETNLEEPADKKDIDQENKDDDNNQKPIKKEDDALNIKEDEQQINNEDQDLKNQQKQEQKDSVQTESNLKSNIQEEPNKEQESEKLEQSIANNQNQIQPTQQEQVEQQQEQAIKENEDQIDTNNSDKNKQDIQQTIEQKQSNDIQSGQEIANSNEEQSNKQQLINKDVEIQEQKELQEEENINKGNQQSDLQQKNLKQDDQQNEEQNEQQNEQQNENATPQEQDVGNSSIDQNKEEQQDIEKDNNDINQKLVIQGTDEEVKNVKTGQEVQQQTKEVIVQEEDPYDPAIQEEKQKKEQQLKEEELENHQSQVVLTGNEFLQKPRKMEEPKIIVHEIKFEKNDDEEQAYDIFNTKQRMKILLQQEDSESKLYDVYLDYTDIEDYNDPKQQPMFLQQIDDDNADDLLIEFVQKKQRVVYQDFRNYQENDYAEYEQEPELIKSEYYDEKQELVEVYEYDDDDQVKVDYEKMVNNYWQDVPIDEDVFSFQQIKGRVEDYRLIGNPIHNDQISFFQLPRTQNQLKDIFESIKDEIIECDANYEVQRVCDLCQSQNAYEINEDNWYLIGLAYGLKRNFQNLLTTLREHLKYSKIYTSFTQNQNVCIVMGEQIDIENIHEVIYKYFNNTLSEYTTNPLVQIPQKVIADFLQIRVDMKTYKYSDMEMNIKIPQPIKLAGVEISNQNLQILQEHLIYNQTGYIQLPNNRAPYQLNLLLEPKKVRQNYYENMTITGLPIKSILSFPVNQDYSKCSIYITDNADVIEFEVILQK